MASVSDPGSGAFLFCSAEDSIHVRLRQNEEDFTDLQLWLNASSNIHDLADALAHNTYISEVCLLIHESFGKQQQRDHREVERHHGEHEHEHNNFEQTNDVLTLFAILGQLPLLQRLLVNTYRFPFVASLPVRAMTQFFQGGTESLLEFKLWRTDLYYSTSSSSQQSQSHQHQQHDFLEWATAMLEHCHNLREFSLIKCRLVPEKAHPIHETTTISTTTSASLPRIMAPLAAVSFEKTTTTTTPVTPALPVLFLLDPVLHALAKLPNLQAVELTATQLSDLGQLSPRALEELLQFSQSLQSFSLSNFDLSEEAVLAIANALLQPRPYLYHHDRPIQASMQSLPTTCTTSTVDNDNNHGYNGYCSTTNYNNDNNNINGGIRHVKLSNVGSTASMFRKPVRDAFRNVLESNYWLEALFVFDKRNLQEEIDFFLKVNRLGRRHLLLLQEQHDNGSNNNNGSGHASHQPPQQQYMKEWMELLVQVQADLPVLFYFLRVNPLILCHAL